MVFDQVNEEIKELNGLEMLQFRFEYSNKYAHYEEWRPLWENWAKQSHLSILWRTRSSNVSLCSPINRQCLQQHWASLSHQKSVQILPNSFLKSPSHSRLKQPSIHQPWRFLGAKSRILHHHHCRDKFTPCVNTLRKTHQSVTMTLLFIHVLALFVKTCKLFCDLLVWIFGLCDWRHEIFRIFLFVFMIFSVYYWVNFKNSLMMHVTIYCPFMCLGNFQI